LPLWLSTGALLAEEVATLEDEALLAGLLLALLLDPAAGALLAAWLLLDEVAVGVLLSLLLPPPPQAASAAQSSRLMRCLSGVVMSGLPDSCLIRSARPDPGRLPRALSGDDSLPGLRNLADPLAICAYSAIVHDICNRFSLSADGLVISDAPLSRAMRAASLIPVTEAADLPVRTRR
jgi:hypothetical protein